MPFLKKIALSYSKIEVNSSYKYSLTYPSDLLYYFARPLVHFRYDQ